MGKKYKKRRVSVKWLYQMATVIAMIIAVIAMAMIVGACVVSAIAPNALGTYGLICLNVVGWVIVPLAKTFTKIVVLWDKRRKEK